MYFYYYFLSFPEKFSIFSCEYWNSLMIQCVLSQKYCVPPRNFVFFQNDYFSPRNIMYFCQIFALSWRTLGSLSYVLHSTENCCVPLMKFAFMCKSLYCVSREALHSLTKHFVFSHKSFVFLAETLCSLLTVLRCSKRLCILSSIGFPPETSFTRVLRLPKKCRVRPKKLLSQEKFYMLLQNYSLIFII